LGFTGQNNENVLRLPQNRNIQLNTNIDENYTIGEPAPNNSIEQRQCLIGFITNWREYRCYTDNGLHDAVITLTGQTNGIDNAMVITIPASAGSAVYVSTPDVNFAVNDLLSIIIEGGGGAGNTHNRNDCWTLVS